MSTTQTYILRTDFLTSYAIPHVQRIRAALYTHSFHAMKRSTITYWRGYDYIYIYICTISYKGSCTRSIRYFCEKDINIIPGIMNSANRV